MRLRSPISDSLSLRLLSLKRLASPHGITRRIIMQKARSQAFSPYGEHSPPTACKPIGFRFYFTPLTGVLFNFPSRYLFTIGRLRVFSLGSWFSEIPAWFHSSSSTWAKSKEGNVPFAYWTLTILGRPFQAFRLKTSALLLSVQTENASARNTSDTTL